MRLFLSWLVLLLATVAARPASAADAPFLFTDGSWSFAIDPASGGLVRLSHGADSGEMNWLREAGHWDRRTWVAEPSGAIPMTAWGLVETNQTGLLHHARVSRSAENVWESVYEAPCLTVIVHREIDSAGALIERYTFTNTGPLTLQFPLGSVGISIPLFDQYPDAARSLSARCHVHLWMGEHSAWINAMRMGTQSPHLGLVLTDGSLAAYSQRGGTLSDRGYFVVHPAEFSLGTRQSYSVAWRLFWHEGWDDFFRKAATIPSFVRMSAARYVVTRGEPIDVVATSGAPLDGATLQVNGKPAPLSVQGTEARARIATDEPGEVNVELMYGKRRTCLRAFVVPPIDELIEARVRFIVQRQQRSAPGDPLDGAYLSYDNETDRQVYEAKPADHNAGRERLAMGVLGAMYYRQCRDAAFKAELERSLKRYADFLARELEDDAGVVYGTVGRRNPERLYNFPWHIQFHLEMYRAFGDPAQLDRMLRVARSYYARDGVKFYAIGLPVGDSLAALAAAGREAERAELLAHYREHADHILANGSHYPSSEVNYEQSIVAPAVQLLLEVYLATGDAKYLDGAKQQLPLLEAFCGRQPDHRLNEISIRHWDDFWFGKLRLYGDTFPHYWSSLNGVVYAYHAKAAHEASWAARADAVIRGNLSLFAPDGRGSAAHVYPLTLNGYPAARNDPWANDQDWALVHLLAVRSVLGEAADRR